MLRKVVTYGLFLSLILCSVLVSPLYKAEEDESFYENQPYLQYDFHTFGLNPKNMHCDTNSFMNNIYLQHHSEFGLDRYHSLGAASYHFMDENNVYINWENIENFLGEEWFMDNGEPIPDKKQFTETHFDYDNRTFSGVLDFAEPENTTVFNNETK